MVLNELDMRSISQEHNEQILRTLIAGLFWAWYETNKDSRLIVVKKWFISATVYVRTLKPAFELLFGPQPTPVSPI